MLKAGLQFIFVILFARNCYLAPFHLDPVVKEALTDLLTAAASHVIFGDADANDLGKRQIQSTNAVRGYLMSPSTDKPTQVSFPSSRIREVISSFCGRTRRSPLSGRFACCGPYLYDTNTEVCNGGVLAWKSSDSNQKEIHPTFGGW